MITNLQYLGIYEDAIDGAIERCEDTMKEYGFTDEEMDDVASMVEEDLNETGTFSDITNSIIGSWFRVTADILQQKIKGIEVDYYVNCHDSHFNASGGKLKKYRVEVTNVLKKYIEVEAEDEYDAEDKVQAMETILSPLDDFYDEEYNAEEI